MKIPFNKALRILLITNGITLTAAAMLGPIYAFFVKEVGGDLLDASYAFTAFALSAAVTTLVFGKITDRQKESELVMVLGYFILGIGFLGYLFVHSIWSLLLVEVIIGLGQAIYLPSFDAVYSKHIDGKQYGFSWGAWEGLNFFSTATGAILGGLIANYLGFNILFVVMFLLSFGSGLLIISIPRNEL